MARLSLSLTTLISPRGRLICGDLARMSAGQFLGILQVKFITMFSILISTEFRPYIDRGKKYTEVATNFCAERNCHFFFFLTLEINIWRYIQRIYIQLMSMFHLLIQFRCTFSFRIIVEMLHLSQLKFFSLFKVI